MMRPLIKMFFDDRQMMSMIWGTIENHIYTRRLLASDELQRQLLLPQPASIRGYFEPPFEATSRGGGDELLLGDLI